MPNHSVNRHIKQQAHHWVRCLNRGLTDDEKPQLIAWVNQDPANHQALYQSASFFDNLNELNELNGIFPLEHNRRFSNKHLTPVYLAIFFLTFILVAVAIINFFSQSFNNESAVKTYITKIGELQTVHLPDGSEVILNTNTKLTVDYSSTHRSLNLLYGEAQFNVSKDKARPFTVSSGSKSFTALGTIFNIQKNNEQDMELIVNEGEVLISNSHYTKKQLANIIKQEVAKFDSKEIISTGEKSIIVNNQTKPTLSISNNDNDLAWQQGMIIFNGESLKQALTEVSRYTQMQFEIIDPTLNHIKVSGYYKTRDIKGLLNALTTNFGIDYKYSATHSVQLFPSS